MVAAASRSCQARRSGPSAVRSSRAPCGATRRGSTTGGRRGHRRSSRTSRYSPDFEPGRPVEIHGPELVRQLVADARKARAPPRDAHQVPQRHRSVRSSRRRVDTSSGGVHGAAVVHDEVRQVRSPRSPSHVTRRMPRSRSRARRPSAEPVQGAAKRSRAASSAVMRICAGKARVQPKRPFDTAR